MGRKQASNSGPATIKQVFPNENSVVQDRLSQQLLNLSRDKYRDDVFPKGMIRVEESNDSKSGRNKYFYPSRSHCFIRNLLELNSLVRTPSLTIDLLWKKSEKGRKALKERFDEMDFRGHQCLQFAGNCKKLSNRILGNDDPTKVNLFEMDGDSIEEKQSNKTLNEPAKMSFISLPALNKIENLERQCNLPEAELNAQKAVLYYEMGNIQLALEFAEKALESDPKNSYAWMVLGFLALQGIEETFLLEVVHREMGAHTNAISAEEQWHQELLEDASEQKFKYAKEAASLFLKAWSNWPKLPSSYLINAYQYKRSIVTEFFKYAQHVAFDKELLKQTIVDDFDFLKSLCIYYTGSPKLLLTTVLPLVHSIAPEMAKNLAAAYVESVRKSEPEKDKYNPPDPCSNELLNAAGANLMHLQGLSLCLPFDEVDLFMQDVDRRFKEVNRISRIMNYSEFYRKKILSSDYVESMKACEAALRSIPFNKQRSYDKRLHKQWQYLKFSMPVHAAVMTILRKGTDVPQKVASLITEVITPELLEAVLGEDYFDRDVEWEEFGPEYDHPVDLRGNKYHVLHYDMGFVKSDIVSPFSEEYQSTYDIPNNLSTFQFVLNHAVKAKGLKPYQEAKLEALQTHLDKLSPFQIKPIPVVTPDVTD